MSHQVKIGLEIRDIEAVKALCREQGWEFQEGKRTYDDAFNRDQPCAHAIKLTGNKWGNIWQDSEIGLIKQPNGAYTLACDSMLLHPRRLGKNASKITQLYGVHKATLEAKRLGYMVSRKTLSNGNIQLAVTGAF